MPVVREEIDGLRVVAADGKDADLLQQPGLQVYVKKACRVVSRVGAEHLRAVFGKAQGAGGAGGGMIVVQGRHLLQKLEGGILSASVIAVDRDIVFQLADDIGESSVPAEFDDAGRRLQLAEQQVKQGDFPGSGVKFIDFDLIRAQIHGAEVFAIRRQVHAVHMGAEIALRHASQALVEDLVGHLSHRAVFVEPHDRHLAVMPAGHEQILVILVCGEVAAPHSLDAGAV